MVLTARSIAEITPELEWVDIKGSVQTVFPVRTCFAETQEESETQEDCAIYHDNYHPLEKVGGFRNVLKVTLRDLSAGPGYLHRINAYFYDALAETHKGLLPQEEIAVSGPSKSLVSGELPAVAGDHPYCLVVRPSAAKEDEMFGIGAGNNAGDSVHGSGVSVVVVGKARGSRGGATGGRASRPERDGSGSVGDRSSAGGAIHGGQEGKTPKVSYMYTNLASLRVSDGRANVYGIVSSFNHRHQSKGRDMTTSVCIIDESHPTADNAVPCNFFMPNPQDLPAPLMVGDIMRIHRAKLQEYKGRPQLLGIQGTSWLIIRKKQSAREVFQKAFPDGADGGRAAGDALQVSDSDEDLEPDEDSQRSGPDAGGGATDAVLPAAEWEVHASSANYTMNQMDFDRCLALSEWFAARAPQMRLGFPSDQKQWVLDIFLRPSGLGAVIVESEVELVCCLTSKIEEKRGGSATLHRVYVADGSGFEGFACRTAYNDKNNAGLLKAMRFALGVVDWQPPQGSTWVAPVSAFLRVEVKENRKEWEALALSPGMWIRLRRLIVRKDRNSGTMTATMRDPGSSVNPLHPYMAEVQAIASAYVAYCSRYAAGGALRDAAEASLPTIEAAPLPGQNGKEGMDVDPESASWRGDLPRGRTQPRCAWQKTGQGLRHGVEAVGGEKRPLPTGIGDKGSSDLTVMRRTPGPYTCDIRVKIKAHIPSKVEEFLRPGPKQGDGDCFFFALCLEDAYASITAVVSGPDARRLLPGNPSPEEFWSNEGLRRRVEELLAGLEGENGGMVTLRVRSHVIKRRHEHVRGSTQEIKGYSIVAPSSLLPRSDLLGLG